ncbi:hypothetical protein OTK49_00090 [Vibrio coralliirubri]|uniref:hypothetical protein n=1 Tax=Vibrio coralliirubri TaxID=1516159 RepID=UPI00228483EB|nr:hypothetical protein [Vibrio coralliirubri]MCY9860939.1 hypothetical protein [Vibrio coralliirubri]
MILSYESLLEEWVKEGKADKILSIKRNKNEQMDYFLSRDCKKLLDVVKEGDHLTLLALLRCFDETTIIELKNLPQPDDQKQIIFDIDDSDELSGSFLAPQSIGLIKLDEMLLI